MTADHGGAHNPNLLKKHKIPAGGWDGKFNGKDVKQGVYFVLVKAKGADGRKYNIKKDVNLLRGYTESNGVNPTE